MTRRREIPVRYCNGGIGLQGERCGKFATVVCAKRDPKSPIGVLEWFACDDPRHQAGGKPTPIGTWFEKVGLA